MLLEFLDAAAKGNVEEIKRRLDCDPKLANAQHPGSGDTALIVAAQQNHPEVIAVLLDHGADVTLYNGSDQTALHVAHPETRAHLLAAVERRSFPQLCLAQAAWQGDLDTMLNLMGSASQQLISDSDFHLQLKAAKKLNGVYNQPQRRSPLAVQYVSPNNLEITGTGEEPIQDVNTLNAQGLTLLMLAVRDVDLFNCLPMEREYRPTAVLEELLNRHGDTHLVDFKGQSAMSYASQVKSPIRQQLIDVLEKSPPPAEKLEEDFSDFCPDRKPRLSERPPSGQSSADIEILHSRSKLGYNKAPHSGISEEAVADIVLENNPEKVEVSLHKQEEDNMQNRKKNSLPGQWHLDFMSDHLALGSSFKRHPSLPPLHVKKDEKETELERLGLGYLLQESFSEPNISEHLGVEPLRNIKYIKENIRQRLSSAKSTQSSQTFPPVSYSPQSPKSFWLQPLTNTSSKNRRMDRSHNAHIVDAIAKTREFRFIHEQNLQTEACSGDVISKDQIQIGLASSAGVDGANNHRIDVDDHASEQLNGSPLLSSRASLARMENSEDTVSGQSSRLQNVSTNLRSDFHVTKTPLNSSREGSDIPLEVQVQNYETRTHCNYEENVLEDFMLQDKNNPLNSKKNMTANTVNMPVTNGKLDNVNQIINAIKMNSPRSPRVSYVPLIQITFSDTKHKDEIHNPPLKHFVAKKNPNLSFVTHNACQSFNILSQKENSRCKKTKVRNNSAPKSTTKHPRPLSNSNEQFGKGVPLPALVYSSVPSLSKKANRSKPNSAEQSNRRSQTQLALYSKNRINSPIISTTPVRAKTSHDFQGISYSDMLFEMKPQDNGPHIYQIFETPVYTHTSKDDTKVRKEPSSASSKRSGSSKSIRSSSSRDSSAKAPKRSKPKNKKSSSATNRQQKNLPTKQIVSEGISEKIEDNLIIISGSDWEIKTTKQEGSCNVNPENGMLDINHQIFSDLSIIKEATIENSLTNNEAAREALTKTYQGHGNDNCTHEHVNLCKPTVEQEYVEGIDPTNCNKKIELLVKENSEQESQKVGTEDRLSEVAQQLQDESTFIIEIINNNQGSKDSLHHVYSISPHNNEASELLTDKLISEYVRLINEQTNSKMLEDTNQSVHAEQQEAEEPNEKQMSRCSSVNDNIGHSNQTGNHSERLIDGSIHWIKGEVLGKGAYGTVYCGLTSQGELIAAKQVMLHGSDPTVAEKEYKKLQEEVDLLKTLKHDNIVGYLGTCFQEHIVTIFMEFVPGGSIASILRHFGPLQEAVIGKYTNHILQGIAFLHNNRVVHRDIKGNNVMLMPNGVIKLIDFGCAKRLNGLNMNGTRGEMLKSMHGTPYWMAPEVISESGHGIKSDIWSIGCTVFEMATGKPPLAHMNKMAAMFYIAEHKGLMPTLPNHFSKNARDFVNLCLIREQEERPSAELLLQHTFISRT
ncbi:mitogen-activated protein kinase kinase kinase 19 [Gastrophryne carolinensis]